MINLEKHFPPRPWSRERALSYAGMKLAFELLELERAYSEELARLRTTIETKQLVWEEKYCLALSLQAFLLHICRRGLARNLESAELSTVCNTMATFAAKTTAHNWSPRSGEDDSATVRAIIGNYNQTGATLAAFPLLSERQVETRGTFDPTQDTGAEFGLARALAEDLTASKGNTDAYKKYLFHLTMLIPDAEVWMLERVAGVVAGLRINFE